MKSPRERLVFIVDAKCAKFFHTKNFKMKGEIHLSTIEDFGIHHSAPEVHANGGDKTDIQSHGLDPKNDAKEICRKEFCRKALKKVQDEYHENKFEELVIIAGPKVLGDIRAVMPKELSHLDIKEIGKDLTHFPKDKIQEYLREIC